MCDSWADGTRAIGEISGAGVMLFILLFEAICLFVLLNLVMGMIVESAMKLGNQVDCERMEHLSRQALRQAFAFCGHRADGIRAYFIATRLTLVQYVEVRNKIKRASTVYAELTGRKSSSRFRETSID